MIDWWWLLVVFFGTCVLMAQIDDVIENKTNNSNGCLNPPSPDHSDDEAKSLKVENGILKEMLLSLLKEKSINQ